MKKIDYNKICLHEGEDPQLYRGAVIPPIFQNSTFVYPDCETRANRGVTSKNGGKHAADYNGGYDYTRVANPTTDITEGKIAALEGAESARCFGSGMAAISAAILTCVKAGDHIVAVDSIYGPTRKFLSDYLPRFQIEVTYIEGSDSAQFEKARRSNTTLFYLESPSSVVFRQQDLAAVAAIARNAGISTVCDNSWASPIFQNPILSGIDLVAHSATKYLGGHSDILAGVVVGSKERIEKLVTDEGCLLGAVLDPFASWLMLRGLRTLPVRMERHQQTTRQITRALQGHPAVDFVLYPGLPDDPQKELTEKQLNGTSSLFSFALKENTREAAFRVVNKLQHFGIGCSWGGFEGLVLPVSVPGYWCGRPSIETQWLIRMHTGLEDSGDIWCDIEQALSA